jgi:hypothetical protein
MGTRHRCLRLERLETRLCPAGAPAANFDKLGAYRQNGDGAWSLDANGDGHFGTEDTVYYNYSGPGVTPVVGDWEGSGRDEIGFFVDGIWSLDANGDGKQDAGDQVFDFGQAGDTPVVGDWTGDGKVKVGVFRDAGNGTGEFILDTNNDHQLGPGDATFTFGLPHDRVVGDWTGDGKAKVGVFRANPDGSGSAIFSLDLNGNRHYDGPQESFVVGLATDGFVVGDWTHSGVKNLGVYRPNPDGSGTAYFTLDTNGNHHYDPGVDQVFTFGNASDTFIVGNWAYNPLTAAFPPADPAPGRLSQDTWNTVVQQSLDAWAQAGLDAQRLSLLSHEQYQIADLPDGLLGVQKPDAIVIDQSAAGFGWNADATGMMDFRTVVMHEQGHALGLTDQDASQHPGDLMADTLAPGERRMPTAADVDAVFATVPS